MAEAEIEAFDLPLSWNNIRWERNKRLEASDGTQVNDSTVLGDKAWLDYRQALRDIPSDFASPKDVVWPIKPKQQ